MKSNMLHNGFFRFNFLFALIAALLFAAGGDARAQSTWVGGGDDANWGTDNNWLSGTAPSIGDALIFTGANVTNNNDFAENTQFNGLSFASGAATFTLAGNVIDLLGNIWNASGSAQTVGIGVNLLGNSTFHAANNLNITGAIGGTDVTITKTGGGALQFAGANTFTGNVLVTRGTLDLRDSGLADNTAMHVTLGNLSAYNGTTTLAFNMVGGASRSIGNVHALAGCHTITATRTSGSGTPVLNIGAFTRDIGSYVTIVTGSAGVATTSSNTNGILGGGVYYGTTTWGDQAVNFATVNGTGRIVAYSAYTTIADMSAPVLEHNAGNNYQLRTADQYATTQATDVPYATGSTEIEVASVANMKVGDSVSAAMTGNWVNNAAIIPIGTTITNIDIDNNIITISQGTTRASTNANVYVSSPVLLNATGTVDVNTIHKADPYNRILDIGTGKTLRLGAQGGIFTTASGDTNVGAFVIKGGNLTAGGADNTAGEIVVRNHGNAGTTNTRSGQSRSTQALRIESQVVDNGTGAVTLTKYGPQQLWLTNAANSYSGGTYVLQGAVTSTQPGSLGTGPVHVYLDSLTSPLNGGQVQLRGAGTYENDFYLAGYGGHYFGGGVSVNTYGAIYITPTEGVTLSGNITLMDHTRISGDNATTATLSGKISGNGTLRLGRTGGNLTNTFVLSNTANDWTGDLLLEKGSGTGTTFYTILNLGASEVIPHGEGKGNAILDVTQNGIAYLNLNGFDETINALVSAGTGNATRRVVRNNAADSNSTLTLGAGNATGTYNSTITSTATSVLHLTKIGTGTQTLSGANTYYGATTVEDGMLDVSGTLTQTSGVTINGGIFAYGNAAELNRNVIIDGGTFQHTSAANYTGSLTFNSGTLAGTNWGGALSGLTIGSNQTVSPGTSPGEAVAADQAWAGGGSFKFEINAVAGAAGTNWDKLTLSTQLDLSALSSSNKFTIQLISLDGTDAPGLLAGFDKTAAYDWEFVSFASLNGAFSPDLFTVDASAFENDFAGGSFFVTQDGTALYVSYIPEPGTVGLALGGLLLMLARRRLRG